MKPTAPRVAIYLRVSTADQTFRSQQLPIADYCRRQGWKPAYTFSEKQSGADTTRAELDRMLKTARAGKIDVIVAYKMDRVGRSSQHLNDIVTELRRIKVRLITVIDGLDTEDNSPLGNLRITMLNGLAQFNRESGIENVKAGQAAARKRGVKFGRPPKITEAMRAQVIALRGKWKKMKNGKPMSYAAIAQTVGVSEGAAHRIVAEHNQGKKTA